MILYSAVCWTAQSALHKFHPMSDLFILVPTRLLWEAFSQAANTARIIFNHISNSYSFIQLGKLGHHGENKNTQTLKRGGFEAGLSRLRVRHYTAELQRSGHEINDTEIKDGSQVTTLMSLT